ncbi:HAD family hydrolase [Thalassorhabdomicrobium marinisediminis]|uniref:HAD family hydrolase n=1 Tax=Thalassorhabdomicrobium marinisediminis TaxID=2170577 RepID=UPI0024922E10|nr:HAD family hydrolase [Thalassorhabdomicrobium marinisediminis]
MDSSAIRGIVFDKDGTLFDFNATWRAWARDLLHAETEGAPERLQPLADALGYDLAQDRFRKDSLVIAATVSEVVDAALPHLADTDPAPAIARFNAAAARAPQVEATPLIAFLTRLREAGLKLGVATNDAETPARAHLDAARVSVLFDFIAGSDSGFGGKPEVGQLREFCRVTGLRPEHCAMVGDSTHDLHAGRAAGMVTVAVLTGVAERADLAPHADVVLDSIADLPGWLGL